MTAPVVRMQVSTVAPRRHPAPKGRGRPVGTPLTMLEGFVDARGTTTAGLAPGRTWLVVVELEDADGITGCRHGGIRQSGHRRAPPPTRAARLRLRSVRGGARLGDDVPGDAQHRSPRRRPARHQRGRHRAVGPVRKAAWRRRLRAARRQAPALAAGVRELALRDGGSRRPRGGGGGLGGARVSGPSSSAFRMARSRGRRGSAGTSSSSARWSRRSARTST